MTLEKVAVDFFQEVLFRDDMLENFPILNSAGIVSGSPAVHLRGSRKSRGPRREFCGTPVQTKSLNLKPKRQLQRRIKFGENHLLSVKGADFIWGRILVGQ